MKVVSLAVGENSLGSQSSARLWQQDYRAFAARRQHGKAALKPATRYFRPASGSQGISTFAFRSFLRGLLRQQHNLSVRSEEHTSELQSHVNLVCRLLLEKKNL